MGGEEVESYSLEHVSFTYPNRTKKALDDVSITVREGEFVTLCGVSGCGKTTLLRQLKPQIAPYGEKSGIIRFFGRPLSEIDARSQTAKIGFVMQDPEAQIVTDKVWHELAFGLESLGYDTPEIRTRVSEMASFFGIQTWFHKKTSELSGGQKQLLNLASIMVMQPSVLLLDEPTGQLDPIAASEFLQTLSRINREFGTTILLSEHRLEEAFPLSDRIVVLENGKVLADGKPEEVGRALLSAKHPIFAALPTPVRVFTAVETAGKTPLNVCDGRLWLEAYAKAHTLAPEAIPAILSEDNGGETLIEMKDVWFRYEKDAPDVIKGLSLSVKKGELFAIVGGNGTGKTTALSLMARLFAPQRGTVRMFGKPLSEQKDLYRGRIGFLPQNPQTLFVKKTVYEDLYDILREEKLSEIETDAKVRKTAALCRIDELLDSHPYDLSGGEMQRAALAKILLLSPSVLLLDEPTKGLDAGFKQLFADILHDLRSRGVTVVMVSHDIEFCAEYADRCAMFFDGNVTSIGSPRAFFAGNSFYTTAANRMARQVFPNAVLARDIILACRGVVPEIIKTGSLGNVRAEKNEPQTFHRRKRTVLSPTRIALGILFAALFVLTCLFQAYEKIPLDSSYVQLVAALEFGLSALFLLPHRDLGSVVSVPKAKRKLSKRTLAATLLILLAIPLTLYVGVYHFGDRKYYFICLLILIETMIPFFMVFENRKPQARELVLISVMCAIAVAGRTAFFMLPQFKPAVAIVILSGVCFGGETGFLVGAVTGFVSNFFFGQGPWTPWQMFALGLIGLIAGILFRKGILQKTRVSLCVYGFLSTLVIYGGIMNPTSVLMWQPYPTKEMILSAFALGVPFDLIHAAATAFFLWFIAEPMIEKLERVKTKYGLMER